MIFDLIKKIASSHSYGFAVRIPNGEPVTEGFAVAYEATPNSFDEDGLRKCLAHAERHANIVGGWYNEDDGRWYWDSVRILTDRDEAIAFAWKKNQLALFDLNEGNEIRL
jgi:hypothetical protein